MVTATAMPPSRRPKRSEHRRGREEARDPVETRRRWLRAGAVLVGAALLLWLSLANTISGIAHRNQASRLLTISPFDARLQSGAAHALIEQSQGRAAALQAGLLAEQALLRDPTDVEALWVLAYVRGVQNRAREATALIHYSDQISRRDLSTRLWLIEERVQANDVDGALRDFDIALRTTDQAAPVLLPILVSAAQTDNIAQRLKLLLRSAPPWRQAFFEQLVQTSRSRSRAVYLAQGQLDLSNPFDRNIARAAFSRFLRENDPAQAFALYDVIPAVSPAARAALVRDGSFDHDGELPPFDWQLTADENLAGMRQGRPNETNNAALFIYSQSGHTGDVARQLLRLGPGRYQLRAQVGSLPQGTQGQPTLRVECTSGMRLFGASFRETGAGQTFTVPGNCQFQWLVIAGGGVEGDQALPWIDDIAIARVQ